MKKKLLVFLLVLLSVASLFAASRNEVFVGLQSGYGQNVRFIENSDPATQGIVPVKADVLFYLGDSFALNAAIGTNIALPEEIVGGLLGETEASASFVADILAYYKAELGDSFALLAGGGLSYDLSSPADNTSIHKLALLASLRLEAEFTDHIAAFAGADVGIDVLNKTVVSSDFGDGSFNDDGTIMPWGIKAGVSYKF